MPEDERQPPTPDLTGAQWRALLETGALEVLGRMPWSSNLTLLVAVRLDGLEAWAVYKPAGGERSLWDFPGGLWRREIAAFELSDALGLKVVPETVLRADGPYGEGSLQRFVDADFAEHYFTLLEHEAHHAGLRRIAGFDLLANNADRKSGHLLCERGGHLWGIDNGLCFHVAPKLRTVMWDFAGEELPAPVLDAAETLAAGPPAALRALLAPSEIAALTARAEALVVRPCFPAPDPEGRDYPWPLV